jgi:hypothetical protein
MTLIHADSFEVLSTNVEKHDVYFIDGLPYALIGTVYDFEMNKSYGYVTDDDPSGYDVAEIHSRIWGYSS